MTSGSMRLFPGHLTSWPFGTPEVEVAIVPALVATRPPAVFGPTALARAEVVRNPSNSHGPHGMDHWKTMFLCDLTVVFRFHVSLFQGGSSRKGRDRTKSQEGWICRWGPISLRSRHPKTESETYIGCKALSPLEGSLGDKLPTSLCRRPRRTRTTDISDRWCSSFLEREASGLIDHHRCIVDGF